MADHPGGRINACSGEEEVVEKSCTRIIWARSNCTLEKKRKGRGGSKKNNKKEKLRKKWERVRVLFLIG